VSDNIRTTMWWTLFHTHQQLQLSNHHAILQNSKNLPNNHRCIWHHMRNRNATRHQTLRYTQLLRPQLSPASIDTSRNLFPPSVLSGIFIPSHTHTATSRHLQRTPPRQQMPRSRSSARHDEILLRPQMRSSRMQGPATWWCTTEVLRQGPRMCGV
jgi:hypothetical protein